MNVEISVELVTIILVGVGLAGVIVPGQRALRRDLAALGERVARIEGMLEWLRPGSPDAGIERLGPRPREVAAK